jgi:hypothetical protein
MCMYVIYFTLIQLFYFSETQKLCVVLLPQSQKIMEHEKNIPPHTHLTLTSPHDHQFITRLS